ncbi:carbohydrate ABC transporter permease [Actinospica sp. MGRD01-02]|uniref:Carbohydrate ABC transporter permease n=1 Tax=Actinospica acidithermotolerans TaxID=2828514 RepID=A0A941EFY4_9ACTN|nr:carbohydrate ABC transporter permease [Actinospica acidithermotolerans]MBR7826969.1 carbohydrate ABC transporter permease [Actinospica acidithermotolerans]
MNARPEKRPWLRYGLLGLFAVPWIGIPLWMLLVNSFKTQGDASVLSLGLPSHWNLVGNYRTVIDQGSYFTGLGNSLLIAIPTILAVLLLGSMAAWSYARSRSRSLRVAYYCTTLSIVLPPAIIPTVYVLTQLGLNGSRLGYMLTIAGTRLGVVVFLATGFIRTLPVDFEEAAALDGAGKWQIYRRMILPLLAPVLVTASVMLIISVWNDFFFALFLLPNTNESTLPLTLYQFASTSTHGVAWNLVFAHVVLSSLPLLIAYVFLQRRVLSGLTEGGVTG